MRSVADRLRIEDREAVLRLTPAERVELALALGARDLESYRMALQPALDGEAAARILQRQRQAGRRRCRAIEELIG